MSRLMALPLRTGLDHWLSSEGPELVRNTRIGVLTHQASVDRSGKHLLEHLLKLDLTIARLWSPEHGLWSTHQDMEAVEDASSDAVFSVPVSSLYGDSEETLAPQRTDLEELDVLIVDLQDVGARYYTYAATVHRTLQNASGLDLQVLLLDRPNPIGGAVEGSVVTPNYRSYVGDLPVPHRHGMTLGELTRFGVRHSKLDVNLIVMQVQGWYRKMLFPETGLLWVPPSPNMPTLNTALVYTGGCLIEGTSLSEGRGTTTPFECVGAPNINARKWSDTLNDLKMEGVWFLPTAFRPMFQKHGGAECTGVRLHVFDPIRFHSLATGMALIQTARRLRPEVCNWRQETYEFVDDRLAIDLLLGEDWIRLAIENGEGIRQIVHEMESTLPEFFDAREPALLYLEDES